VQSAGSVLLSDELEGMNTITVAFHGMFSRFAKAPWDRR
jgi:hypothetical protein